jgi:hypothetical protein
VISWLKALPRNLTEARRAAQVGKRCRLSLWPDESSHFDAPAQHHDLIACLNLIQQEG